MSVVLRKDGLEHLVTHVRFDGSNHGVDYELVHTYCGVRLRFGRTRTPVLSAKLVAPLEMGVATCVWCAIQPLDPNLPTTLTRMGEFAMQIEAASFGGGA